MHDRRRPATTDARLLRPPDVDREIEYAVDPWGQRPHGRCRLRSWRDDRVALVTEIDGNPSMSVTKAAEYVAQVVRGTLGDNYVLVEHYEASMTLAHRFAVILAAPGTVATFEPLPPHLHWLYDAVVVG